MQDNIVHFFKHEGPKICMTENSFKSRYGGHKGNLEDKDKDGSTTLSTL